MKLKDNWHKHMRGNTGEVIVWTGIGNLNLHKGSGKRGTLRFENLPLKFNVKKDKSGNYRIYKVFKEETWEEIKDMTLGEFIDAIDEYQDSEEEKFRNGVEESD